MGLHSKYQVVLVCVLLLPALCLSRFTNSRATYYNTSDGSGTPTGACGFGDYGRTENSGRVAGVSGLWRGGAGCGACYQVKCNDTKLCRTDGVTIVVTDMGSGDRTDFVMSLNGFLRLGLNANASDELRKKGTVDIQYRRVRCTFGGSNVKIKINENSRFPDYLAIAVIYVPGSKDVVSFQISNNNGRDWKPLRRVFGGVFDLENAPSGPFKVRVQFSRSQTWAESPNNVIPADWKVGAIYDSRIHVDHATS
ncbi:hypothetical protein QN277_028087 [Acacia crassicarpa]|uniref:Expansin-like B1 n=1 Tax=Acacia crassicarpa TaxID=499986 RepID=A0AAE1MHW5_9FABA|nr:hypothetical protein QN277_028087 [Acacia crassicarpa]